MNETTMPVEQQNSYDSIQAGRGSSAEHYDSLVCVRSPYTGELESPKVIVDESIPRISQEFRPKNVSRTITRPSQGLIQTALFKFRFAAAGIAVAVCVGFLGFMMLGAGRAPGSERVASENAHAQVKTERLISENENRQTAVPVPVIKEKNPAQSESLDAPSSGVVSSPVVREVAAPIEAASLAPKRLEGNVNGLEKAQGDGSEPDKEAYDALLEKVKKSRRAKERVSLLRQAIACYPEGDEALARLSIMLMELPKTRKEALELATRATEINAQNAAAWLAIGFINQLNGSPVEARKAYGKCAASSGPQKYVRDCRRLI